MQVTAAYAKANFPELLKTFERGETAQIIHYNKPVANLALSSIKIVDPNWAEPLNMLYATIKKDTQ